MKQIKEIKNYQLCTANGTPIRIATKVIFTDGSEIKFMERMTKKEARKQVEARAPFIY